MYNVLIADDEKMARETLKVLIKRKKLPIVIYEATNGREAIAIYKKEKIDFVFLDIKMPGIDGLEAGIAIKEYDKDALIIYLTAWDSFEYAKKAIQIGVKEYLVKPVLFDDVYASLDKLQAIIDKRREVKSMELKRVKAFNSKFSRYFFSALKFDEIDEATLLSYFNIKKDQRIQAISFIVGKLDKIKLKDFINNSIFINKSLYYFEALDRYTFIVFSKDIDIFKKELNSNFISCDINIGLGIPFYNINYIGFSIRQASIAYSIAIKNKCYLHEYQMEDDHSLTNQPVNKYLIDIEKCIFDLNVLDARNKAHELTDSLRIQNDQKTYYESVLILQHYLRTNIKFLKLPSFNLSKFNVMEAYLFDMITTCVNALNQDKKDKWKRAFNMIEGYINANYAMNLSASYMASMLDLNEKYFSKLFKSYFSIKYIDFLTKTRMENAKKLLLDGLCVNKVALLCGYNDSSYFSKVFAQYYDTNPSEYNYIKKNFDDK
jgi:two-component system response regulator YesN